MKLKFLAAAAAVLCGVNAHAGINTIDDKAELFLVVWDSRFASYVFDTGVSVGSLLNQDSATQWNLTPGSNFAEYQKLDTNLSDFADGGTAWALYAVSNPGGFEQRGFLSTSTADKPLPKSLEFIVGAQDSLGDFALTQNSVNPPSGLGVGLAGPGDSFVAKGDPLFYDEVARLSTFNISSGNAVGRAPAKLNFCSFTIFDDGVSCVTENGKGQALSASFDGTSLAVTAVPEPGTYALLLAGLAGVGAMVRRRRT